MRSWLGATLVLGLALGLRKGRSQGEAEDEAEEPTELNAASLSEQGLSPWDCKNQCGQKGADGCCYHDNTTGSCQWCPGGSIGSPSPSTRWSANCFAATGCNGWTKGKWCAGSCSGIGAGPAPGPAPPPAPGPSWELAWSDEFNACPNGRPDPANWGYERGYVRNSENQWYQESNAACVNGKLVITSRREPPPNWVITSGRSRGNYTSTSLTSRGLQTFGRGRYELRAKIPIASGSWPAWWLLGDRIGDMGWPNCGEIDMMEYYTGKVLANFAYGNRQGNVVWDGTRTPVDNSWASRFHIWAMEWDETKLTITLDNKVLNTFRVSTADGQGHANPYRDHQWYMLINTALGGASGGDLTNTQFPLKYEVDYVRYYRRA